MFIIGIGLQQPHSPVLGGILGNVVFWLNMATCSPYKGICDQMLGIVTNYKANDKSEKREKKRELELSVLKWQDKSTVLTEEAKSQKREEEDPSEICAGERAKRRTE